MVAGAALAVGPRLPEHPLALGSGRLRHGHQPGGARAAAPSCSRPSTAPTARRPSPSCPAGSCRSSTTCRCCAPVSDHSALTYLALVLPFAFHAVLHRTPMGLRLRAVGEKPHAVATLGLSVPALRWGAVLGGGLLAGLGGAVLSTAVAGSLRAAHPRGPGLHGPGRHGVRPVDAAGRLRGGRLLRLRQRAAHRPGLQRSRASSRSSPRASCSPCPTCSRCSCSPSRASAAALRRRSARPTSRSPAETRPTGEGWITPGSGMTRIQD